MISPNENSAFGDVIYSYTRAQAIADGVLVDLSQFEITRQHWKMHVACTDTVWNIIQMAIDAGKDRDGILHDIFFMARLAIANGKRESIINFRVKIGAAMRSFKMICGPGDTLEPVLTLLLPHED